MENIYKIKLKKVVEEHSLNIVHASSDFDTVEISNMNVSRPALQFAGFYDYFQPDRLQIMGKSETAYLRTMSGEEREKVIDRFFSHKIVALIVCGRIPPDPLFASAAKKYDVTLLTADMETSEFVAQIINTLRTHLAPRTTVHGVLVQVHGEGLLITGDSGIGKSEVALELVKRGHRLVADDAVEIRRMNRNVVTGSAPKMIRYLMELRGLGIIDVRRLYGVGSVLPYCQIDLAVNFEAWDHDKEYDRLGLEDEKESFLGVPVPKITIPVAPARNLAIILEVAAMNNRQKKIGHNTAKEFVAAHDANIDSGWKLFQE